MCFEVGQFGSSKAKEEFMASYLARGVLLVAISLVRCSWWSVLQVNYTRVQEEHKRNIALEQMSNK